MLTQLSDGSGCEKLSLQKLSPKDVAEIHFSNQQILMTASVAVGLLRRTKVVDKAISCYEHSVSRFKFEVRVKKRSINLFFKDHLAR